MSHSNSSDALTWVDQAKSYLSQAQYADALNCVHQGLVVDARNAEAWLQCGNILQRLGLYEDAITANHNAQRLFGSPDARIKSIPLEVLLAQLQGHTTNNEHQATNIQEALHSSPSSVIPPKVMSADEDFWWQRAQACTKAGDYAAALAACDKVLEFNPTQAQTLYYRGLALFHLQQYEDAIASFEQATEHQPNLYQAWNNRASILIQLGNFTAAIDSYEQALRWTDKQLWQAWEDLGMAILHTQGLEASIATLEKGIQALWCDADDYQLGCGSLHQRKGDIQVQHAWRATKPQPMWKEAKLSYLRALDLLDFQTFPQQHLEIWHSLLRIRFHLQETTAIHAMLLEAAIKLQTLKQASKLTPKQGLQLEQKFVGFQQMQVDWLISQNQLKEAVLWVERCKDLSLGYWRFGPEYEVIQPQYKSLQTFLNPQRAIILWHVSPAAISTFILKQDHDPLLLSSHPTLSHNTSQAKIAASPTGQRYRLKGWLQTWQKAQQTQSNQKPLSNSSPQFWIQSQASQQLNQLAEILEIPKLCDTTLAGIQEIILVVPPILRGLPVQFLFPEHFGLTMLPSLQIGLSLLKAKSVPKDYLLNLVPPKAHGSRDHDSKFVELETFAIGQSYRQQMQLTGIQLTRETVMAALKVSGGRMHFTGRVEQDRHKPENTGLELTPQYRLSLTDLTELNWQSYSMVCLAGGPKSLEQTSNSILDVDLETVLLSAGVQHIISSLWTVNHFARVLLMAHLHQLLSQNCNPVHALKQAQHWLRTLTYTDIIQWCTTFADIPGMDPKYAVTLTEIETQLLEIEEESRDNRCPYHHPWYWAGFIVLGNFPEIVVW